MSDYIPVPVSAAKAIAEQFQKSAIVILAWDPVHACSHSTTYGVTAAEKIAAAYAGDKLATTGDHVKKLAADFMERLSRSTPAPLQEDAA